ncbi:salt tolerance down-regulator domain-containing protein [Neurospora intermedia]|uniref:Stress response protein NST1 n=1 Tax=Neurospora intermedia TaxID=5142 RepID=A0ABR3DIX7_NEUIN
MKGNSRHPSVPPPPLAPQSPTSKATAKYTNKDGSKFITVPKGSTPADSAQLSPTITTAANAAPGPQSASISHTQGHGLGQAEGQVQPVNKKKAKRRQKAAAKAAATQGIANPAPSNGFPSPSPSHAQQSTEADHDDSHDEHLEEFNNRRDSRASNIHESGFAQGATTSSKKSKKKKKKSHAGQNAAELPNSPQHDTYVPAPQLSQHPRPGISKEKIWNTSSQEERERIKEFWLGLSETERKELVRVEKDAVLKKMKEQQKHTCSCTVCGRKRTAIEEELEGLYDAYYEELEQYANHPNQGEAPPMLGRRPSFGSMTGMRSRGLPTSYSSHHQPSHAQIVDHGAEEDDEEEEVEEEYSEDEPDEDDFSDDEPSEELHRSDYPADFFNFGNSLTVQGRDRFPILPSFLQSIPSPGTSNNAYGSSSLGGILTVADDLLKNDGKKFIEMMEQLAERRMAREEDARDQFGSPFSHSTGDRNAHYHPPADDEVDDEEYDEDYDDDEEEEYDSQDEEETMTEEQRMEEGRRMFQIFAARMFEQRVLTAYREKVARERQNMLLEELADEKRRSEERLVKKQKEAQKKKERQARKKELQAEEKARREEEKMAEEKAKKAEEDRQKEQRRQREEEKRKQKEAQKKAEEEERRRKEAERQRRNHEREENERKARELKEREKKAREEARLKEKEAREQKEREAKEQKELKEREKREREAKAKAEMEATKAVKDKSKQEDRAAQKAAALATTAPVPITLPKRPAQPIQTSVPAAVPALPQQPAAYASPVIPVATPAFPKVPAPAQSRQIHQQESVTTYSGPTSQSGSAASQNPSPHTLTPILTSPGPMKPLSKSGVAVSGTQSSGVHLPSPAPSTTVNAGSKPLQSQANPFGGPSINMPFQPTPQPPPSFSNHMQPQYPPFYNPANSYNRVAPGMMAAPPGFSAPLGGRAMSMHSPGFPRPLDSPVSSFAGLPAGLSSLLGKDNVPSHTRQGSGSFEIGPVGSSSQPISRPTPIGRPASVVHGQLRSPEFSTNGTDQAEQEVHLGSSALLEPDDTQQDFPARSHFGLLGTSAPGVRSAPGFGGGPFGMETGFSLPHQNSPWNPVPPLQHNPFVPPPPGFPSSSHHGPWSQAAPPGIMGRNPSIVERSAPWSVTLRKSLCAVCEDLGAGGSSSYDGFIPLGEIMAHMKQFTVNEKEVLDICDTEGNPSNGGGSFIVRDPLSPSGSPLIRYVPDDDASRAPYGPIKHPGDIGSPIVGSGSFHVGS